MAAQEYEIKSVKKAGHAKGAYGGRQTYALALKGIGEPVKLSLPEPILEDPEVGDQLYGRLVELSAEQRKYYELKLEPRTAEQVRTIDIHAQVALKLAVEVYLNTEYDSKDDKAAAYSNIAKEALHFAKIIEEVKKELI
jgi:hypothetical protein